MKKPIQLKFDILSFPVSGIQVRYLKIVEKSGYQAFTYVKYITKNGEYQIRMVWFFFFGFLILNFLCF